MPKVVGRAVSKTDLDSAIDELALVAERAIRREVGGLRKEMVDMRSDMATKKELAVVKDEVATVKVTVGRVLQVVESIDERLNGAGNIKERFERIEERVLGV